MGRSLLLFVFIIAAFFELSARHKPKQPAESRKGSTTTIFLVRHAEKVTTDPADQDPDLTAAGLQRAQALQQYLQDTPVDAFFSTPYKRSQRTLSFLTQGRPVQFYEPHDVSQLRTRVLTEYKGKTIVIVGHSNTLLPIIEAFGAKSPLQQISEDQYDNLFRLKISPRGKASVQAFKYGAQSS